MSLEYRFIDEWGSLVVDTLKTISAIPAFYRIIYVGDDCPPLFDRLVLSSLSIRNRFIHLFLLSFHPPAFCFLLLCIEYILSDTCTFGAVLHCVHRHALCLPHFFTATICCRRFVLIHLSVRIPFLALVTQ